MAKHSVKMGSDRAACAIYTSGSTGEPKGVLLSHRGLVNRLHWMREMFAPQSDEVFVQKTSLNFVDHVAEIFQPLCQGTPLVILNQHQAKDINSLVEAIHRHRITRITLVPSLLRLLVEHAEVEKLNSLRYITSSGEALSDALARQVQSRWPQVQLINLYGSTEVSADVTYSVYEGKKTALNSVSIGGPIANSEVYVLDGEKKLLPLGARGELYVSGACLARGYLKRNEDEMERFVAHPYKQGERLYRTGDIVKWSPDGKLHYLGREDNQIKLRGMRLESGEIEEQLRRLPEVREAVVLLCAVRHALDQRLVAYLIARDALEQEGHVRQNQTKALEQICRKALKERLPEYMVPAIYVFLESLPLTATGKVDRKALPAPQESDLRQGAYVAPKNEVEALICKLWQDILQVERVGIEDNFFELGGHSLLAVRLMNSVREALQVELPLKILFDQPTVAGLSESRASWKQESLNKPLIKLDRSMFPRLSFAQERMLFICSLGGYGGHHYNMPSAFRIRGDLDLDGLKSALKSVVSRHESLRTIFSFYTNEQHPSQRLIPDHQIPIESVVIDESELSRKVQEGVEHVFDLVSGPPILIKIFKLSEQDFVLFINVHHINFDGWSVGIMLEEISSFYTASIKKEASSIQPLPVQYLDYALWQRERVSSADFNGHAKYWQQQLIDMPKPITFNFVPSPAEKKSSNGGLVGFSVDEALGKKIQITASQMSCTPYMYFLSIFYILLWQISENENIVIGAAAANRNTTGVERLIGLFVNTLPLRMHVTCGLCFADLLEKVKNMTLGAQEYQEYPFEKIVEIANPERDFSRNPIFQVMINFNSINKNKLFLEGVEVEDFPLEWRSSKMELSLNINELDKNLYAGNFEYSVDIFESKHIESLKNHFLRLLEIGLDSLGKPLLDFPVPNFQDALGISMLGCESDILEMLGG